jgi:hypothetical protein
MLATYRSIGTLSRAGGGLTLSFFEGLLTESSAAGSSMLSDSSALVPRCKKLASLIGLLL